MNEQTTFDADAFMNDTVDAPMATTMSSVPDGEYQAVIGDFTSEALKTIEFNDKKNPGQKTSRQVLEVPYIIQDAALAAKMEREQVVHRETYWLDFDANGKLATGPDKNVRLGQLRAALGQNSAGWSPSHLRNMGPLLIAIKSKSANDPTDPEKKYTNITKYAKIS
jgi:hypothetical protein